MILLIAISVADGRMGDIGANVDLRGIIKGRFCGLGEPPGSDGDDGGFPTRQFLAVLKLLKY